MCWGKAEWKDSKGVPRWSEKERDRYDRFYTKMGTTRKSKTSAALDTEIADTFTPEFYQGRKDAYKTEFGDEFQTEYDSALNEIKEGFIRRGIFDQSEFDALTTTLGGDKTSDESRLDTLAEDYADLTRTAVADQKSDILDDEWDLTSVFNPRGSALYHPKVDPGGDRGQANDPWRTEDFYLNLIKPASFDFSGLTDPVDFGETPDFLSGYDKLYLNASAPVVRTSSRGKNLMQGARTTGRGRSMTDAMGLRTPYTQSSQRLY